MITTYLRCTRCWQLSDRREELRRIARNKFDLTICGVCIRKSFEEASLELIKQWERERFPLLADQI